MAPCQVVLETGFKRCVAYFFCNEDTFFINFNSLRKITRLGFHIGQGMEGNEVGVGTVIVFH